MVGTVQDVVVLVMALLSVVMVIAQVMKHTKHAQKTVTLLEIVMKDIQLTALMTANAGLTVGLVTDSAMELQSSMVQTYVATIMMAVTALKQNALKVGIPQMSLKLLRM
jgi:hypothetical protein